MIVATLQLEWRRWLRSRAAVAVAALLGLVTACSVWFGMAHETRIAAERQRAVTEANRQWFAQPDRHPHRVVHFGDFAFREPEPLSRFDPGVLDQTGSSIFLEGHRQNSANFRESGPAGDLLRMEGLHPASILQLFVPLVLLLLGYATVSGERVKGTLQQVFATGASKRRWLIAKVLSLFGLAMLIAVPIFLAVVTSGAGDSKRLAFLAAAYTIWLLLWSVWVVLVSWLTKQPRHSLAVLLGSWLLLSLVLPRILLSAAELKHPTPSRVVGEMLAEHELKKIGDSHNPNDPHFAAFRAETLAKYGVSRVEDLPVNYGGLLMLEGERLTTQVFRAQAEQNHQRLLAQSAFVQQFALINPLLALQRLSRACAGTDLKSHLHFLEQAESRRFELIQTLNQMHATKIDYANDREQRVQQQEIHALARTAITHLPFRPDWQAIAVLSGWATLLLMLLLASASGKRGVS